MVITSGRVMSSGADTGSGGFLLERNIELVLRGAAKVLGCNSATLLVIDEEKEKFKLKVATFPDQFENLEQATEILGLGGAYCEVDFESVGSSIVFECYRTRRIKETSNVAEVAGSLVTEEAATVLGGLFGKLRFSCVPVLSTYGVIGIVLFTKKGSSAFSVRQRELQLEYASRLGMMMESEQIFEGLMSMKLRKDWETSLISSSIRRELYLESGAMLSLDGAQMILSVNEGVKKMFLYEEIELIGAPFEVLFEEDEAAIKVLECRSLLLSEGHMELKATMRRKDGTLFRGIVSGILAIDGREKGEGAVIKVKELPAGVEELKGIEEWKKKIKNYERLEAVARMASQMAHEIRNPLVSIGAALRVIKEDFHSKEDISKELQSIIEEIDRLDGILQDYLFLSRRATVGRIESVNLTTVLEDAIRVVSRDPRSEGIKLTLTSGASCEILGDPDALKQVFMNLLLNGVESSFKGGEVRCEVYRDNYEVIVRVLDSGEGLNGKNVDELFEPFYTTKPRGSGLGLTISKSIIEELGGQIELQQRREGGCEVIVRFSRGIKN